MRQSLKAKVMVTGAGGFIGSHLTEALVQSGCHVRAMVRYNSEGRWGCLEMLSKEVLKELEVCPADIRDPHLVRKAVHGCDAVFHLAALIAIPYSYHAPASFVETNAMGTLNIAQACLDENVRCLVHTSTSETYGTAQYVPIDENHPQVAQSPYSASKIAADRLVESFFLSFGLPAVTIRPFNTFGPRQSARAVIPTIISQLLAGNHTIKLGSTKPVREFNYVKDTVRGLIAAAACRKAIGKTLNLGSGKAVSIGELVGIISGLCNTKVKVVKDASRVRPEASEVMQLCCDSRQAHKILGWKPKYDLKRGLRETVDWMQLNIHRYKPEIYNL
jgi:NAD dependent epimerase/dehydratase